MADKKHKHGVKLYVVCESSGTALRIKVYTRSGDDISGKGHVDKVVFHLMKDFLNQGHSVFMDNYYSSFGIVSKLLQYKSYCTGTFRKTRKGDFKTWNEYKATLKEYENKYKRNILEPIAFHYYSNYMNGIDRKDQMLFYYSCSRKTFKCYIKLWIHLVETLVFNSFNLYKTYSPTIRTLSFNEYRLEILKNLIGNPRDRRSTTPETNDHLPGILLRNKNRNVNRKICREYYKEGKYKRSNYLCPACIGNPRLCLGECFKRYHQTTNV
ncbi:uncharacterized protein LOC124428616 [Vespa crabro]|uniref:uncharacterized protein LOC124428616 n=1 Tax=Vespa crabro TaxID=7445 RepID=UPI001F02138F|nr:uncharacterized protein LOC124428616 [Vespa crabro]